MESEEKDDDERRRNKGLDKNMDMTNNKESARCA